MMRALVHQGEAGLAGVRFTDMPEPSPGQGQVKVRLKTVGMNHRDILVLFRRKPGDPPVVLGSDGAGVVESVGPGVTRVQPGDEVVINPSLGWVQSTDAPPPEFEILGVPTHGTFAEFTVVPETNVEPRPEHLTWEESSVLGVAGLTGYRALFTKGNLQPGQTVLIPGVGGGASTLMLLFAKAVGARVIVTSRHEEKLARALALGADLAIPSTDDWVEHLRGEQVDLVIENVGPATLKKSFSVLKRGGTMVTFGATTGDEVMINLREFFYGHFKLFGTTLGSAEEFRNMLGFLEEHRIHPVRDMFFSLEDGVQGFQRMDDALQFGKLGFVVS